MSRTALMLPLLPDWAPRARVLVHMEAASTAGEPAAVAAAAAARRVLDLFWVTLSAPNVAISVVVGAQIHLVTLLPYSPMQGSAGQRCGEEGRLVTLGSVTLQPRLDRAALDALDPYPDSKVSLCFEF